MSSDDRIMASPFKDTERRKEYQREYHKKTWYSDHKLDRIGRSKKRKADEQD